MKFPHNPGLWLKRHGAPALLGASLISLLFAAPVLADGHASPGQMGMLTPVTPIAEEIHFFYNDILTPIIFAVSIFVGALLLYVVYRFNEKANPTPSVLTHHTGLEVAWTIAPVLILVFIAIPSFRLLDHQLVI
ncbi:MAG TPA: cytochrome c oxidase subunit II transmembrane domain-containing protein, partial [Methylovirgula sp.]